jgi:hypothetical protein
LLKTARYTFTDHEINYKRTKNSTNKIYRTTQKKTWKDLKVVVSIEEKHIRKTSEIVEGLCFIICKRGTGCPCV